MRVVSMDEASNLFRAMPTANIKRKKTMAANIEKDIQEWLGDTEPYEDDELDSVLIAASNEYECSQSPPPASVSAPAQTSSSHTRFVPPTTEEEIQRARKERIPQKTRQDTKFCTPSFPYNDVDREGLVQSNHPELVTKLYTPCYLCNDVVRKGSIRWQVEPQCRYLASASVWGMPV